MTDQELREIIELWSATTQGEWECRGSMVTAGPYEIADFQLPDESPRWGVDREAFCVAKAHMAELAQELLDARRNATKFAASYLEIEDALARASNLYSDLTGMHKDTVTALEKAAKERSQYKIALDKVTATLEWLTTHWDVGVQEQARAGLRAMGKKTD